MNELFSSAAQSIVDQRAAKFLEMTQALNVLTDEGQKALAKTEKFNRALQSCEELLKQIKHLI